MPALPTCPDAPRMPTLIDRGSNSLIVSCNDGLSDGGSAITSFTTHFSEVTGSAIGLSDQVVTTSINDPLTQNDFANRRVRADLVNGRSYTVTCRATNAICQSPVSPAATFQVGTCPSAPTNANTALTSDHQSVDITWTRPADNGGYMVDGCRVQIQLNTF